MAYGNLANCSRCDALFVKGMREVCPKCYQEIEKEYDKCARFLRKRENRGATIYQLSEETGVSVKQITKFIREGRISVSSNPNLGYPCENCNTPITSGNICDNCSRELRREIIQQLDVDQRLADEEKRVNNAGYKRKAHKEE